MDGFAFRLTLTVSFRTFAAGRCHKTRLTREAPPSEFALSSWACAFRGSARLPAGTHMPLHWQDAIRSVWLVTRLGGIIAGPADAICPVFPLDVSAGAGNSGPVVVRIGRMPYRKA